MLRGAESGEAIEQYKSTSVRSENHGRIPLSKILVDFCYSFKFTPPYYCSIMTDKIKYVTDIRIIKSETEPGFLMIKAKGIAAIDRIIAPVLRPGKNENLSEDGIYELEFILDSRNERDYNVDIIVDVELRIKNLPENIKGLKIIASDNADIELL